MLSILTYAWSSGATIHTGLGRTMRVVAICPTGHRMEPRLRAKTIQAVPEKLRYGLNHKKPPARSTVAYPGRVRNRSDRDAGQDLG
ncbi:hypothetical protein Ate01nite_06260 [Actinoplanes teichomyceticus]|nr:hypothetical protein Ate01nite_06260 [Actinoplanes teichomyceticus]